ncbi:MAG: AraD1 family protein [bacterium]
MTRLVQLGRGSVRRVGLVTEPTISFLSTYDSVYALALAAIASSRSITALINEGITDVVVDYDAIYDGRSEWRLLPPIDHPAEPARLLVSGTGLTHLGSAANRQSMHMLKEAEPTDSMKMFRLGVDGGRPADGQVGVAPEWFYKGDGGLLRAHGEPLVVPPYAGDGGEEGEIAGVYVVGPDGSPWRIGMCTGNEFSDHKFEKLNYLNLASSKIRTCSIGPELVVDPGFAFVAGTAAIERAGAAVWSKDITTGASEMCHSLRNMEHHHFKFDSHRRPGDVHVHYYGACSLSFGDGFALADGDVMSIRFDGFGRPLRNSLLVDRSPVAPIAVRALA